MQHEQKNHRSTEGILPNFDAAIDIGEKSSWFLVASDQEARVNLPYMQEVGYFYTKRDYYTRRVDLPSYLYLCTLRGSGELQLGSPTAPKIILSPGTICWIDCKQWHRYACSANSDHWDFLWLHAYGGFLPQYFEEFIRINGHNLANIQTDRIAPIMLELISIASNVSNLLVDTYLAANLINTLSTSILTAAAGNSRKVIANHQIQEAIQYIDQHFTENITLEEIANHVFLSKHYFHRLFTQTVNCTPHTYVNTLRIRFAKELLRNTAFSVQEISAKIGFENHSHFTQVFKNYESITPLAYRKKWSNQDPSADPLLDINKV